MNKRKVKRPVPNFTWYKSFADWHDNNIGLGGKYFEDEIDGNLIGVLCDEEGVIGLWYNNAGFGTISKDYATLVPDEDKSDLVKYSEYDSSYPY